MLKYKIIGFIGGGNMAEALIKGLLAGGVPAAHLIVSEPVEKRRLFLSGNFGLRCIESNSALVAECDVIVLAIKPQIADKVLEEIGSLGSTGKLFISIMAGIRIETIEAAFHGKPRVVRIMPNTPALVMEAASAVSPGTHASSDDISLAQRILELVGKAWLVEEKLLDAVTGLSGSGPAYVLTFIEALSDAGVKNGLPRDVATGLAAQTVFGTAKLLIETREHPAVLRDKVTSPGGTTIAGLHALENDRMRGAVMNAVSAAVARSREMGAK